MTQSYMFKKGVMQMGPYSLDKMRALAGQGQVGRSHQISKDGGVSWDSGVAYPEIFSFDDGDGNRSSTGENGSRRRTEGHPSVPPETEWYVSSSKSGQQGPMPESQLRHLIEIGAVSANDIVWTEPLGDQWVPAGTVPKLSSLFSPLPSSASRQGGGDDSYDAQPIIRVDGPRGETSARASLAYADFFPRAGAALLDGVFVGLLSCVPSGAILVLLTTVAVAGGDQNPDATAAAGVVGQACSQLVGFVISAIYSVTLDSSAKQGTWGKQWVGLKVTDLDGRRITAGRAFGRFLARYLSACLCGIGFLLPLFQEKRQTLHELISGCVTVNK